MLQEAMMLLCYTEKVLKENTALHCTALRCTTMQCAALHCTALHYIALLSYSVSLRRPTMKHDASAHWQRGIKYIGAETNNFGLLITNQTNPRHPQKNML